MGYKQENIVDKDIQNEIAQKLREIQALYKTVKEQYPNMTCLHITVFEDKFDFFALDNREEFRSMDDDGVFRHYFDYAEYPNTSTDEQ